MTGVDRASSLVCCGGGLWQVPINTVAGVNLHKSYLFHSVSCQEPSTLTQYWSYSRRSIMVPDLSHFVGWGPCWFCRNKRSSRNRGGNERACSLSFSSERFIQALIASFLSAQASRHVAHTEGFLFMADERECIPYGPAEDCRCWRNITVSVRCVA